MPGFASAGSTPIDTSQWPKCPNCGLPNIPERRICKRCRTELRHRGAPASSVPYTDVTGRLYVSTNAYHLLFVNPHYLEYRGPGIMLHTAWANVECIRADGAEDYVWLAAPAAVTMMRSGDAAQDTWLERTIPLRCFRYPTNPELLADLQRFAPQLWPQQPSRVRRAILPDTTRSFQQQQRQQAGFSLFLLLIPVMLFVCVAFSIVSRPASNRQGFSIESTISRANRIIAIDASDRPLYRWVFTTPEDYTVVGDNGAGARHDPAQISYGTGWTNPSRSRDNTVYTNLTDGEWQIVEQWRKTWCREAPLLRAIKSDERYYIIALRCSGYNATTLRVPQDQMPKDITTLLRRSS